MNLEQAAVLALEALESSECLLEIEVNKAIGSDAADLWVEEKRMELKQHEEAIAALREALAHRHDAVEAERERCAKVCDSMDWSGRTDEAIWKGEAADECAAAIRSMK